MRIILAFLTVAASLAAPALASAHPDVDEAQRLYGEADFEGALAAYARAEQGTDLSRADLIELYVGRAMLHHTLGDTEAVEVDLLRLAILDPEHAFDRQIPPVVREAFERIKSENGIRAPMAIRVDAAEAPGGLRLEARVEGDLAAIVQALHLAIRTPGTAWTRRTNAAIEFPVTRDQEVEYYASAVGPGGATVATDGTEQEPLTRTVERLLNPIVEDPRPDPIAGPVDGDGMPVWPFLVGGAVAAVAGGVLLAVLLSSGNDATQVACCSVDGP